MEPEALLGGKFGILFLDQLPQLMRGVMGAVDDALRQAPQAGHGFPFRSQGLGDGFPVRQGVLPAGLAEPPDEGFFIGLQEDEVEFEPLALQAVEDPGVILQKPLGTHVHHQGDFAAVPGGAGSAFAGTAAASLRGGCRRRNSRRPPGRATPCSSPSPTAR